MTRKLLRGAGWALAAVAVATTIGVDAMPAISSPPSEAQEVVVAASQYGPPPTNPGDVGTRWEGHPATSPCRLYADQAHQSTSDPTTISGKIRGNCRWRIVEEMFHTAQLTHYGPGRFRLPYGPPATFHDYAVTKGTARASDACINRRGFRVEGNGYIVVAGVQYWSIHWVASRDPQDNPCNL